MSISISVLIPNYNGRLLLEENLPSVKQALLNFPFSHTEIVISDDFSQDESLSYLRLHHPEIVICSSKENTGFSGAVNRGISRCHGELILILNSDVSLHPHYFQFLIPLFEDPRVFGVMGAIYSPDGIHLQDGAKYPVYQWARIGSTLNYTSDTQSTYPTFFLSGANALVRQSYLVQLEGFSEIFNPYYCEDVDLGIRAWRAGWKCLYEGRAVCYHPNSVTIKKQGTEKVRRISKRNKALLHLIHLEGFALLWYKIILQCKAWIGKGLGKESYWQVTNDCKLMESEIGRYRKRLSHFPYRYSFKEIIRKIKSELPEVGQRF